MANIEPNQYIQYEKWCRSDHKKLTALEQARVLRLKELDALCKKCRMFPDDQMKCEGTRQVFPVNAEKIDPKFFRLEMQSCHKLDAKVDHQMYLERLKRAGISKKMATELLRTNSPRLSTEVTKKGGHLYFDKKKLHDFTYEILSDGLDLKIKEYIIALANCGFQGVYLFTVNFYRSWVQGSSRVENIKTIQGPLIDCDWLVVEAIDYSTEATYFREALFTIVRTRVSQLKPTTIIQTRNTPQFQSEMEKTFFAEVMKWPKINLT
jgi:hypothetical protein